MFGVSYNEDRLILIKCPDKKKNHHMTLNKCVYETVRP